MHTDRQTDIVPYTFWTRPLLWGRRGPLLVRLNSHCLAKPANSPASERWTMNGLLSVILPPLHCDARNAAFIGNKWCQTRVVVDVTDEDQISYGRSANVNTSMSSTPTFCQDRTRRSMSLASAVLCTAVHSRLMSAVRWPRVRHAKLYSISLRADALARAPPADDLYTSVLSPPLTPIT